MSTIRIFMGIICCVALGCSAEPSSHMLSSTHNPVKISDIDTGNKMLRAQLVNIARSQMGVQEATGNNDGLAVEAYLKVTTLPKGNPWCAAFISWVFKQAGLAEPRTAWSPALFPLARQTLLPQPADVFGIYSQKLKRIAHAGLVEQKQHHWIISIEGNTNADVAEPRRQERREGNGVYRKWRHIKTIAKFADWVKTSKTL